MTKTAVKSEPLLESLKRDEAIIAAGLDTFREVGWALMRIRDGKKYRALPEAYKTFEDYCERRWDMSRANGNRLILSASLALGLPDNVVQPKRETQMRALLPLRDNPEALGAAWTEAVELANGDQPTGIQVREVVLNRMGRELPVEHQSREGRAMPREDFYDGLTLAEKVAAIAEYHHQPEQRHISEDEYAILMDAAKRLERDSRATRRVKDASR